jgi:hypothetical protein
VRAPKRRETEQCRTRAAVEHSAIRDDLGLLRQMGADHA